MSLAQTAVKQALERVRFSLTDSIDHIGLLIQRYGPNDNLVAARSSLVAVRDRVIQLIALQ